MNWKTTAAGIVTAVAAFVMFAPELFNDLPQGAWWQKLAAFIAAGGLASLGIVSKDGDKGGTAPNPVVDAVIPPPPPDAKV
jgi:hypothetical protein